MDPVIVSSVLGLIGIALSVVVSYAISKQTAKSEIKKMELTWQREDHLSFDQAFSTMIDKVSRTLDLFTRETRAVAYSSIARLISVSPDYLLPSLEELRDTVYQNNPRQIDIERAMNAVVHEQQKHSQKK